jgi:hypothetical protein
MKVSMSTWWRGAALCSVLHLLAGCATPVATNSLVGAGATTLLGHTPTTNIVQTYYLGVFDPREQLPPTIYRIRVQGQAGALSATKFASGWVRAELMDSLAGQIVSEGNGVKITGNGTALAKELDKGALNRRLIMFGPEGFREAPKDHRLAVVMGSDPEAFFGAVDRALGVVAQVTQPAQVGPDVLSAVWADMARLREERRAMQTLIDVAGKE